MNLVPTRVLRCLPAFTLLIVKPVLFQSARVPLRRSLVRQDGTQHRLEEQSASLVEQVIIPPQQDRARALKLLLVITQGILKEIT